MSTLPYPGLRPFHRDEADIFFGRDEQVDQLLLRLGKSRFLAVVGPSGCGKSSLVHTGLLNALDAGLLAGAGLHWRIATMQPGSHPMQNLANALVGHLGMDSNSPACQYRQHCPIALIQALQTPEESPQSQHTALLLASLRRGPLGLLEILRDQPLPANTNLLLVVDQFEEIFRYREHQDRDEADAFVALLLRSLKDSELPIYIVMTMRSDFLGDCALFPGLPETLNDSQFLTPRLNREQRRVAITGPAKVCGGEVEPALVNRLLNDMGADPDQLPILQHALMRLWTDACKRDDKPLVLKLSEYEALGGWENALSNHADEALAELDQQQQVLAEILFRALSERSGAKRDTRRPVTLQAVADIAGVSMDKLIPVIDVFRQAERSFILPPQGLPLTKETLLDISHESLIRQWQRMKDWVEQEAQSAETYRRLEQSALLHSQKKGRLLQGLDLFPVLDWRKREKPNPAWAARYGKDYGRVKSFLDTSVRWHKLKAIGKVLGFIAVCVIAAGMAWLWQDADTERRKAASAQLLAEGQLIRSQEASKYPLSALFGIEAMKQHLQTHNALNQLIPDIWDIEPEDPRFMLNQFLRDSLGMLPKPGHLLQHDGPVNKVIYNGQALMATIPSPPARN